MKPVDSEKHIDLLLGSASPRRRRILADYGFAFECVSPQTKEYHDIHDPLRTVTLSALGKLRWCQKRYPKHVIITADTAVEFAGRCLGKPRDEQEALEWLCAYSGREQRVYTAVAVGRPSCPADVRLVKSSVRFKTITPESASQYIALAHPLDRAGAYDIDTEGNRIVESYEGSYTNIMGLPMEILRTMI